MIVRAVVATSVFAGFAASSHSDQFVSPDGPLVPDVQHGGSLAPLRPVSDSGLPVGAPADKHARAGTPPARAGFDIHTPLLEVMTELGARGRGDTLAGDSGPGATFNSAVSPRQRQPEVWAPRTSQDLPGTPAGSRVHAQAPGAQEEEEDLTSLTADVDESIEQLNQLILDLDPTFVPVPTGWSAPGRSASLHAGVSPEGRARQSGESPLTRRRLRPRGYHGDLSAPPPPHTHTHTHTANGGISRCWRGGRGHQEAAISISARLPR